MAISTIRKLTDDDEARIEAAAARYCIKRNIDHCEEPWTLAVDHYLGTIHPSDESTERYSWQKAFCRALREPYDKNLTTGYGYVGVYVG